MVMISVCSVWFGLAANKAHHQFQVATMVRNQHGVVTYDFQQAGYRGFGPFNWARQQLGEQWFSDIVGVRLECIDAQKSICDDDHFQILVSQMKQLGELRLLELDAPKMSDDAFESLAKLQQLDATFICLAESSITPRAFQSLKRLTHLRWLVIFAGGRTEELIRELECALPNCHTIWFGMTKIIRNLYDMPAASSSAVAEWIANTRSLDRLREEEHRLDERLQSLEVAIASWRGQDMFPPVTLEIYSVDGQRDSTEELFRRIELAEEEAHRIARRKIEVAAEIKKIVSQLVAEGVRKEAMRQRHVALFDEYLKWRAGTAEFQGCSPWQADTEPGAVAVPHRRLVD